MERRRFLTILTCASGAALLAPSVLLAKPEGLTVIPLATTEEPFRLTEAHLSKFEHTLQLLGGEYADFSILRSPVSGLSIFTQYDPATGSPLCAELFYVKKCGRGYSPLLDGGSLRSDRISKDDSGYAVYPVNISGKTTWGELTTKFIQAVEELRSL